MWGGGGGGWGVSEEPDPPRKITSVKGFLLLREPVRQVVSVVSYLSRKLKNPHIHCTAGTHRGSNLGQDIQMTGALDET